MTKEAWLKRAPEVSLSDLWGVGGAMSRRFRDAGLNTVSDLLAADPARVAKLFGVYGTRLRAEVSGEATSNSAVGDDLPKSIMSTRSFSKTTTSFSVLAEALAYHVSRAAEELRGHGAVAGKITALILTNRHDDWVLRGGGRESLLPQATSDTRILLKEALRLSRQVYEEGVPYKKAGVVLGFIRPDEYRQAGLFEEDAMENESLMKAVDHLNRKIGIDTVTIGRVKDRAGWDSRRDHRSPAYTTDWNELPRAR